MKQPSLPMPQGFSKRFKGEDTLVEKILKRGLSVSSEDELRRIIRITGYYRFTGYLYPFRKQGSERRIFKYASERFIADLVDSIPGEKRFFTPDYYDLSTGFLLEAGLGLTNPRRQPRRLHPPSSRVEVAAPRSGRRFSRYRRVSDTQR